MICYDREYPESARELMLQGAELILVPNDCDNMRPRLRELSVRAIENMTGIAMANPPGPGAGRSCAYSPVAWDGTITQSCWGMRERKGFTLPLLIWMKSGRTARKRTSENIGSPERTVIC